jgi:hypothetical protein
MQIKSITYQRVFNLGNYETKRLELTAELSELDDVEAKIGCLTELVERKIRQDSYKQLEEEIGRLQEELRELKQRATVTPSQEEDPDIPFDSKDTLGGF